MFARKSKTMNRFKDCEILWREKIVGKYTGLVRYVEAVLQTKDGKLYYVSADYIYDPSAERYADIRVYEIEKFNNTGDAIEIRKKPGFVNIEPEEHEYLGNLLLREK